MENKKWTTEDFTDGKVAIKYEGNIMKLMRIYTEILGPEFIKRDNNYEIKVGDIIESKYNNLYVNLDQKTELPCVSELEISLKKAPEDLFPGLESKDYLIKRQPTFLIKGTTVPSKWVNKFFTPKAIKAMVEDGFIEEVTKPEKFTILFESEADPSRPFYSRKSEKKFTDISGKDLTKEGDKLLSEMLSFKDKGTRVLLHELKEDQLGEVIGEFSYLRKKIGDKIALHVEVPLDREEETHNFFTNIKIDSTAYSTLDNGGSKRGWIYYTGSELFITEIVAGTIANCLIITEYT
jgi:hypothetical protein